MKTHLNSFTVLILSLFILAAFLPVYADFEPLEDGVYSALFKTDSSMFRVCEANEGRGILTVKDGEMTIHVSLTSKNHLHLFYGVAADAKKEGAELLDPVIDKVVYSDGYEDEVHGFDIPVPYLDEEFDVALIGKKGKWYDHKVSVSDPIRIEERPAAELADGNWLCDVTLKGGSGRASVESPAVIKVQDGEMTAVIIWSSKYYEYMLIGEDRYEPVNQGGNSTFEIPAVLDSEMAVSASTVAMSQPHLIEYTLYFDGESCRTE